MFRWTCTRVPGVESLLNAAGHVLGSIRYVSGSSGGDYWEVMYGAACTPDKFAPSRESAKGYLESMASSRFVA